MTAKTKWLGNARVCNTGLRDELVRLGYQPRKPVGHTFKSFEELHQYEMQNAVFIPPQVDTWDKVKEWVEDHPS